MARQVELKEVAARAGCTPGNIRWLLKRERIPPPAGKIGQTYVWDDDERLATWLATRPRPGRPPAARANGT